MTVILLIVGGAITSSSWWLFLHVSDERVQRWFRQHTNRGGAKSETEGYIGISALWLMVMGSILLIVGVLRLVGVVR